jgi:RNA polymerase sigma factor (sigma-70 family)
MPVPLDALLHHLQTLAVDEASDGQLLERFVATADEAAFAALVRRHGGLVHGVCRRFLGAGPDVEDAFQATFLVLARKAASIHAQSSVGSWLYGVAYRLALRLKSQRARRKKLETPSGAFLDQIGETKSMRVDPSSRAHLGELAAILDEELQRLPTDCRDAVVLCHLEGLSNAEAAKKLGCLPTTLKARLLRTRQLLRQRLERRGIALSAMALSVVLAEQAHAAVPVALRQAALRCVAHRQVSARVAALAEGALPALAAGKHKMVVLAVLAVGLLGLATGTLPLVAADRAGSVVPPEAGAVPAEAAQAAKDAFDDPLPDGAVARLGTVRWRHAGPTTLAAFLPGGNTVLSAGADRTVRVWEYPSGKELRRIGPAASDNPAGPGMAGSRMRSGFSASLSGDSKTLVACFESNVISLFDVATGKEWKTFKAGPGPVGQAESVRSLAFSPDGRRVALLTVDGSGRVLDCAKGTELCSFAGPSTNPSIYGTAGILIWSPDGKMLATVKSDTEDQVLVQAIEIWDAATGTKLRTLTPPGKRGLFGLVFAPASTALAFAAADGTVSVVDAATGQPIRAWQSTRGVTVLLFSRDGGKLYGRSSLDQAVVEWDATTGKMLRKLGLATAAPDARVFAKNLSSGWSPDGHLLVLAGSSSALQFIDVDSGKEAGIGTGEASAVLSAQFTPNGKQLFTRHGDRTLHKWDAVTGKQLDLPALPQPMLHTLISPDGKLIACTGPQGSAVADAATGKELGAHAVFQRNVNVGMLFSPDSKILAVHQYQDKKIALFEMPSGKPLSTIAINPGGPERGGVWRNTMPALVIFSPDSKVVAAFTDPTTLSLCDTASGEHLGALFPANPGTIHGGVFSPDGRCLAIDRADGGLTVYELASGQVRRTYGVQVPEARNQNSRRIVSEFGMPLSDARVAFGPGGQTLCYALDRSVLVWDVTSGQEVAAFQGHTGAINSLVLAPDGKTVASTSADTTVLLWDLTRLARPAPVVKALTAKERDAYWQVLVRGDAAAAFAAICALSAASEEALPLILEQIKPALRLDPKRVEELLASLESDKFKTRQEASAALLQMGERVVPAIDRVLAGKPPLEVKKRLQDLRQQLSGLVLQGERLRAYRAIEVVERIGTPGARQVLQVLAEGAPDALLTSTAQTTLKRLTQQK